MHALQCAFKVFLEVNKGPIEGGQARDEHIIVVRAGEGRSDLAHGGLQPAAYAVADDGAAEFLGDGEAEAGLVLRAGR